MSVKSKHSASKRDKNEKNEKKKSVEESNEEIESSEEELDLTKECHPIGHYINDRAEMINQMFSVIKGNKLKAMLPPILKDCDTDQLKLQCLDQLLGMSEKRIMCILEGGTLESSSESEVCESDEFETDEKSGTTSSSSSNSSNETYENGFCDSSNKKNKKRKSVISNDTRGGKILKNDDKNSAPEQGKTLLEILELEMRARAIRALLKQSGNEKEAEPEIDNIKLNEEKVNNLKETFDEVVDLTECEDEENFLNVKTERLEKNNANKKMIVIEKDVEKQKKEKTNEKKDENQRKVPADAKNKNKLIKKKIYRTRQQTADSDEASENEKSKTKNPLVDNIIIKTELVEPKEPEEILVEDPEEGEISTSEENYPVEIKQEVLEEPLNIKNKGEEEVTYKVNAEISDISANVCIEKMPEKTVNYNVVEPEHHVEESLGFTNKNHLLSDPNLKNNEENETKLNSNLNINEIEKNEKETAIEETSWRDRWLQKDGVQKLVKSSKIYAKVKKRIAEKSLKAKEEAPSSNVITSSNVQSSLTVEVIEGSIKEYEKLFGKVKEKETNSQ